MNGGVHPWAAQLLPCINWACPYAEVRSHGPPAAMQSPRTNSMSIFANNHRAGAAAIEKHTFFGA